MTDAAPELSAQEKSGRALVARTSFQKESIWLPSLAVHHMNAGQMAIDGKTFTECLIEGPAVIAVLAGTTFEGCNMGTASDPRTLLYRPVGDKLAGVVGLSNCQFISCRFVQVGFTGSDDMLEQMQAMLLSARSQTGTTAGETA